MAGTQGALAAFTAHPPSTACHRNKYQTQRGHGPAQGRPARNWQRERRTQVPLRQGHPSGSVRLALLLGHRARPGGSRGQPLSLSLFLVRQGTHRPGPLSQWQKSQSQHVSPAPSSILEGGLPTSGQTARRKHSKPGTVVPHSLAMRTPPHQGRSSREHDPQKSPSHPPPPPCVLCSRGPGGTQGESDHSAPPAAPAPQPARRTRPSVRPRRTFRPRGPGVPASPGKPTSPCKTQRGGEVGAGSGRSALGV